VLKRGAKDEEPAMEWALYSKLVVSNWNRRRWTCQTSR